MIQLFCIVCYAPKLRTKSMFCQHCFDKIFPSKLEIKKRTEGCGVEHYYLFDWNTESDVAARAIVYFLKHKPCDFFEEILDQVQMDGLLLGASALVPPSSTSSGLNHAVSLAEALMKQNVVSCVFEAGVAEGVKMSQQKRKNREQRLKSNLLDLREFMHLRNWVFVDDVFVSGGTFKSISESMFTKPKAVFTLFYKPRLKNKGFYDA